MATGYGRQSVGSAASIAEQKRLYFVRAGEEGWGIKDWYEDAVSASTFGAKAGKVRDAWPVVQANLSDVLWLWESSRGDRKASAWLAFLELCQENGTRIYVEQHERYLDPRIPGDWKVLATDGVDSEMEVRKSSKRVRTGMNRNVLEGATHGRVPFGYTRRYSYEHVDGKRRRIVIQEPDPETAPIVKEIFARIKAGHSLKSIARDLNARGILHSSGRTWTETKVRATAMRILYAGKRVHKVTPAAKLTDPDTVLTDAQWPALVKIDEFWAVYNKLTDPSRLTHRPGGAKHLLSLLAVCGVCGGGLIAAFRYEREWRYICRDRSCVMIREAELDAYVTAEIIRFLSDEANYPEDESASGEIARINEQVAERQASRERLADAVAAGMDPVLAGKTDTRLVAEIRNLNEKARSLAVPSALRDFAGRRDDIEARWKAAPLAARREVVRLVFEQTGPARLLRHPAGRKTGTAPTSERVVFGEAA